MDERDRQKYVDRYEKSLHKFGYSSKSLCWGQGNQYVRFGVLCNDIVSNAECSVLDVGCGFADLYDYLTLRGWYGKYEGIDIVPGLLEVARSRHPNLKLHLMDLFDFDCKHSFDYVIASGIFNAKIEFEDNTKYIQQALQKMFNISKVSVCVDFLSTYVDYQHPIAWHTDPSWAFAVGKSLSKRVALRHDYMPYEFALFIYRDDMVTTRNVFESFERKLKAGMIWKEQE